MTKDFMGAPTLTSLYGDDVGVEVIKAARKYGVSPIAVMQELQNDPSLLGASFADVVGAVSSGVKEMAPSVATAIQTLRSGKAIQPMISAPAAPARGIFGNIDPKMLLIPAVGIALVILLKQMKKKESSNDRGSRRR